MRNFEVKAIVTMVFPNVKADTEDAAIAMVAERIPATIASKTGHSCNITIDDFNVNCYDFMDASNNHDADLVEKINHAWDSKRDEFIEIVDLLSKRDLNEDINPHFYLLDAHERCHRYCHNVANDNDLRTIILYCRQ